MSRKQLIALSLYMMLLFSQGAYFGLMPIYLAQLGIDPAVSGLYFALGFSGLTVGSLAAGWISNRFQRRRETLIVGALLATPLYYFMGKVNHIVPLTMLTVLLWCIVGFGIATINIIAGMFAETHERGRVFGVLGVGVGIGAAIGGLIGGTVVDRWGFPTLFNIIALIAIVLMLEVLLIEDKKVVPTAERQQTAQIPFMTLPLWLLFIASVLQAAAIIGISLSRPLGMNALGLSATAISSTNAIASLVTLPLPFVLGWASDRVGRKPILLAGYAFSIVGALILVGASSLWHFWLSAIMMSITGAAGSAATAMVTDLTPPETLGTALARFGSTGWIGAALGFTLGGLVIANADITASFLVTAVLAAFATLLVYLIRTRKPITAK
jgi:MFS transporter, DHA1 family, tetracycline resistance protein